MFTNKKKGGAQMADALLLGAYVNKAGKSKTHLAKALNVSRPTLYKILDKPETCTCGQADVLCSELNIRLKAEREQIFLP